MPGLAARRAALDILAIMRRGRSLDEALAQGRSFTVLQGPDRAFARNMVSTCWRRRGSIDAIIGAYLDRPLPGKSIEVMDILRLAATQLVLLDTPAHAAVATATELAGQKQETRGYAKLVNAICRRIAEKGKDQLIALPLRTDTPGWLWRSLERAYGPALVTAIAEAHRTEAPLDLSLKPGADISALTVLDGTISHLPGHVRLSAAHDVTALPGFEAGDWWVQDIAASLPARLLGDVTGQRVLDLCAAPGGKTLQLAAAGARVTALDISGNRLRRLQENLARTGLPAETIKADMLVWEPAEDSGGAFDAILLDAPCTATGTVRRNPDVAWAKSEQDVKDLTALQTLMIDRALGFLKPGGLLVYCVCSLLVQEGEDQVKAALSRHGGLAIDPIAEVALPGLEKAIRKDGTIRTLPSMLATTGGMDGFYAAALRKPA
ncbi:methyltransferase domain-containing protein [Aquisalinus flavus]|nr:methyltransferase domain-containing protein [Aquisalinus flavus]UNE49312.1 methyltransferase domain-containing protein [Aquisalinus flavus]